MRVFSNGLKGWKRSWRGDLRASLSVAFISIPLGLGIGLASGVPPLAAVIPAVIGGLIFAWFSGGHIVVHSTPKMLIGVTAAAVATLGITDMVSGYRLFLAAVVIAGLFQFLLGLLRLGVVGDVVPASVIKSLLAAVGIIIIVKQLPVLVGSDLHPEDIIYLIKAIPELWTDANLVVTMVGIVSVVIMFMHPKVEFAVVKAVPAAVWVIIVSIASSYALGFAEGGSLLSYSYGPQFLIDIPDKIKDALVTPDFSQWQTAVFWNAVIAVVIVSSIEGILSAKAIDRLDPWKRKSNVNRELRVMGLATSASGMIGGLPVIPGIVPSSVGVSHNGKTQLTDVFQAVWILLLFILLGSQLQHIPLAALAGILIHTGYKLINPSEIINTYRIGWDQTIIFFGTLIVTLTTDLITGIASGVVITLAIHVIRLRSFAKLFTILFRPNVVTYQEMDADNKFHVSVKGYVNFLNYPRLKNAMTFIPSDATINLDLSLTEFIDHTVLEHLSEFEEAHIRRGGQFEIVGMDLHLTTSKHPLAVRFKREGKILDPARIALTSRQKKLQALAQELAWEFDPSEKRFVLTMERFHLFRYKTVDRSFNHLSGTVGTCTLTVQDLDYHEGEFQTRVNHKTTSALVSFDTEIPLFTIEREHILDRLAALAGYDDIDFEKFQKFSDKFRLKGEDEEAIRSFFSAPLINFLDAECKYRLESSGRNILILGKDRPMSEAEIKELIEFCTGLTRYLNN